MQPIRSEVIKKQSEILVELLDALPSEGDLIHGRLDYSAMAVTNVYKGLSDLGFVFKNHEGILNELNEKVGGFYYVGDINVLSDVEVVGVFEKGDSQTTDKLNIGKLKFEKAKEGIIEIDKLYYTVNHQEFFERLTEFYRNPYLPKAIQQILKKIMDDIGINLHVHMKAVLASFLEEFCSIYFCNGDSPKINAIGVFNQFNHNRISHENDIRRLRKAVRDYLMIDEKWE